MGITSSRAAAVLLAAAFALTGCASHGNYDAPKSALETQTQNTVTVDVSNHNWADVVIYAISAAGNRVRLGSVTTGTAQRFRVPRSLTITSGNMTLEAHPIGSSDSFQSGPIMANPGSRIIWSVENQLTLSNYRVAVR
jgi:hypothetical protein